MKKPFKASALLAVLLVAAGALVGCGSSGEGEMSDQQKIDLMKKAHDTPIGPSSAATSGAATGTTAGSGQ